MTDIPELTEELLEKAIPARLRKRLMQEQVVNFFDSPADLRAKAILSLAAAERELRSTRLDLD